VIYRIAPVSIALFVTSTFTASLNISLVWIKLASNVLQWIAKERMVKLSNIIICIGICFWVTVFLILAVARSYSGAAILTIFMAVFVALAFLFGARLVAKKLEVLPKSTQLPPNNKKRKINQSDSNLPCERRASYDCYPQDKEIHVLTKRADTVSPKSWKTGKIFVSPKIRPEFSVWGEKLTKEENELSEGARAIMDCANAISANCWGYCCASSLYVIFLQNIRFGIVSAFGSVILSLNAICVNMLILKFLSAEKLSYRITGNKIIISPSSQEADCKSEINVN